MWWADKHVGGSGALLVLLQADGLSLAWLAPAGGGQPARWRSVQTSIQAKPAPQLLAGALPTGAWRSAALRDACRTAAGLLAAQAGSGGPLPAGLPMVVLAAPPWLNEVVMPWTGALLHDVSAQDQARGELVAQGWAPAADDELRVDVRPGLGRPRSVLLVPGWLTQEMRALAQALSLRWHGVQSLVAVAARWAARQPLPPGQAAPPLLGLWSAGLLRLVSRDGTPALVGAEWVDDAVPPGQPADAPGLRVARLWQRAGLRFPALRASPVPPLLAMDAPPPLPGAGPALHWLPWPGPGHALEDLHRALLQEALRPGPTTPAPAVGGWVLGWRLALSASLLGAVGLAWSAWQYHQATAQLRLPAPPVVAAAVLPLGKAELAELRVVNAAVGRINLAVLALLRALQPPPDIRVSLLGLDLAGAAVAADEPGAQPGALAAPVKLDAQARSAQDMTRYLAYLASRPGLLGVQLLRHERPQADDKGRPPDVVSGSKGLAVSARAQDAAAPAAGYRFQLEMSWQP